MPWKLSEQPLGAWLLASEIDVSETLDFGITQIDKVVPTARRAREVKQNARDHGWFEM
jgi:hypothetical protein